MARLFGFIGNRPDLGVKALEAEPKLFEVHAPGRPLGWGVGYYQGDEVLLRRRPLDERPSISFGEVLHNVHTDTLIGHVRLATIGTLRTENTHPFRFRQWLFAHTGTLVGFDNLREKLLATLPDFLRRNLRGDTDSEALFHVFLASLHQQGNLQNHPVDPPSARAALRAALAGLTTLSNECGAAIGGYNLLLTNGACLIGVHHHGGSFAYQTLRGSEQMEHVLGEQSVRKIRAANLSSSRLDIVAADFEGNLPGSFVHVEQPSIVTFTRTEEPVCEPL